MYYFVALLALIALTGAVGPGAIPATGAFIRTHSKLMGWSGGVILCTEMVSLVVYLIFFREGCYLSGTTYDVAAAIWLAGMVVGLLLLELPLLLALRNRFCYSARDQH